MPVSLLNGVATEATLQLVVDAITTSITDLPHEPTDDTTDLAYTALTRSTSGETSAIAAVALQTTRVHRIIFTCAAACTIELLLGSGGTSKFKMVMPDKGGYDSGYWSRPFVVTGINQALFFKTTGAVQVDIQLYTQTSVPA